MKKYILTLALALLFYSKTDGCIWIDPNGDYFNLFTQSIIKDKSYLPFLHNYGSRFNTDFNPPQIPDENLETWQRYFQNKWNYTEIYEIVNKLGKQELIDFRAGKSRHSLFKKLGTDAYEKFKEGIDYLIVAKHLEPFMNMKSETNTESFYDENAKDASNLDYDYTIKTLNTYYNETKNPEIKQRYGFQLVRFYHYTLNYNGSIQYFKTHVQSIPLRGATYYMALDQLAGAQNRLNMKSDANWNFFQVFIHSKSKKESAFISMTLTDSAAFNNVLKRAKTKEEKNMAYFLLGYVDYNNPIHVMKKMFQIDPSSEILKVLAARSINDLERSYLLTYYSKPEPIKIENITQTSIPETEKLSFWQKIVLFFKNLFGLEKEENHKNDTNTEKQNTNKVQNTVGNTRKIPFYNGNHWVDMEDNQINYLNELEKFAAQTKEKSKDEFWQIAHAYLKFLQNDYHSSTEILTKIKTSNPEYVEQIKRMKVLNDILSQPKITAEYEDYLMNTYANYFILQTNSTENEDEIEKIHSNDYNTQSFSIDILANRYFLQGEYGKSFLMNNELSDFQYNPDIKLVKYVEAFYRKPNKSKFEKQIIAQKLKSVGNIDAFFNVIYGDDEMRKGNFAKAKSYYQKAIHFSGVPRDDESSFSQEIMGYTKKLKYSKSSYNGFRNIPSFIFGHNVWESFRSPDAKSMKAEDLKAFPFIKPMMNKLELTEALIQLKKIGEQKGAKAAKANQLIGNVIYNTSLLGYYREVFVMDIDNSYNSKFEYYYTFDKEEFLYYYKRFQKFGIIEFDHFDMAIKYYQKALNLSNNREQKARILFQMASAEQGKFYLYKRDEFEKLEKAYGYASTHTDSLLKIIPKIREEQYRTYFNRLKSGYADTETAQSLMGSCSYFNDFMKKK